MSKPIVTLLVTDLDNTLFDWFSQWYHSFNAMLERLVAESKVPREQLIGEIKTIHQRHKTSEYAFLIEEIPSLREKYPGEDLAARFDSAIHTYRKARKQHLELFPTVLSTLEAAKKRGTLVVGYTESMAFYSNYRVRELKLDGILDYLYSPPDHDLPPGLTPEQFRKYPAQHYDLKTTKHRYTPRGELKPNPRLLLDIVDDVGGVPSQTAYIGDNLWKDVQMAQLASVHDVHAAYGTAHSREEYALLVSVTHWSDADVQRERELKESEVKPKVVLRNSFSELLQSFEFVRFISRDFHSPDAQPSLQVEIWKKIVDVQQHFNDIELKIRNLAVTFLGAVAGAVGVAIKSDIEIELVGKSVPLSAFFLFASLWIWAAFYLMDRHWYHRLLYGAVKAGMNVEARLQRSGLDASGTIRLTYQGSPANVRSHCER